MKFLVLATLFAAMPAFAGGGSSIGPSACSQAKHWCTSADQTVSVCIFNGNPSLYAMVAAGDTPPYNVEVAEIPPSVPGAPFQYLGSGIDLKICTSCADQVGHLDIPGLQINNLTLDCRAH